MSRAGRWPGVAGGYRSYHSQIFPEKSENSWVNFKIITTGVNFPRHL